jgi:hypothetical protein
MKDIPLTISHTHVLLVFLSYNSQMKELKLIEIKNLATELKGLADSQNSGSVMHELLSFPPGKLLPKVQPKV